jgi:hypothetical protein
MLWVSAFDWPESYWIFTVPILIHILNHSYCSFCRTWLNFLPFPKQSTRARRLLPRTLQYDYRWTLKKYPSIYRTR